MEIIYRVEDFDAIPVLGNRCMLRCIKIMGQIGAQGCVGESIWGNWAEMDAAGREAYGLF